MYTHRTCSLVLFYYGVVSHASWYATLYTISYLTWFFITRKDTCKGKWHNGQTYMVRIGTYNSLILNTFASMNPWWQLSDAGGNSTFEWGMETNFLLVFHTATGSGFISFSINLPQGAHVMCFSSHWFPLVQIINFSCSALTYYMVHHGIYSFLKFSS